MRNHHRSAPREDRASMRLSAFVAVRSEVLGVVAVGAMTALTACERLYGPEGFVVEQARVVACTDDQGVDRVSVVVESVAGRSVCFPDAPEVDPDLSCERVAAAYRDPQACGRVFPFGGGHSAYFGWAAHDESEELAFEVVIASTCDAGAPSWSDAPGTLTVSRIDAERERARVAVDLDGARGTVSALYCDLRGPR